MLRGCGCFRLASISTELLSTLSIQISPRIYLVPVSPSFILQVSFLALFRRLYSAVVMSCQTAYLGLVFASDSIE